MKIVYYTNLINFKIFIVMINNFEEEVVTTSKSEDQFVLDDQQGLLYSMDKLLFGKTFKWLYIM